MISSYRLVFNKKDDNLSTASWSDVAMWPETELIDASPVRSAGEPYDGSLTMNPVKTLIGILSRLSRLYCANMMRND